MTEAARHEKIGVVVDGPSGQRLVERLTRCGLAARVVLPGALDQEAPAGQFYLAPLGIVPDVEALARRGASLCLIPPWPAETITTGTATVGVAPAEQRGVVRFAAAMGVDIPGQNGALTPLKILYREYLVGAFGTVLAESEQGEPLLATLPRASNLHGYTIVSTLQLSVASAQTRFDDVARLVTQLRDWCARHVEPVAPSQQAPVGEAEHDDSSERYAPIVLLALALVTQRESGAATWERVRETFDRVRQMLGLPAESSAFALGWAWLEAHGVVSRLNGDVAQTQRDALERYIARWQLGPRLRRLRQSEDAGQGGA